MKLQSGRSLPWVAALLLLAPAAARADFYSNWSFSWSFNPIPPNGAGFVPADAGMAPGGTATGGAQFAATSGTAGAGTIPVATVSTTSAATTTPDSFQGTAFTFGVTITDNATNASGTLTFDGVLNGQLTGTSSSAVATFSLDPSSPSSLTLSGHTYQAQVDPSLALGAPNQLPRLLNATVTVGPAAPPPPPPPPPSGGGDGGGNGGGSGGPQVASVPEPSASALAGVAVASLGLARWRRRQRGRAASLAA
jgi:hypothetical protein